MERRTARPRTGLRRQYPQTPLAIANEGSTTAFVTCDFETLLTLIGKVIIVNVRLHNASATARQVSCLLLDSFSSNVYSPSFFPKSATGAAPLRPRSLLRFRSRPRRWQRIERFQTTQCEAGGFADRPRKEGSES
jgi:hypothetical protein